MNQMHLNVDFDQSPPPKLSPSVPSTFKKKKNEQRIQPSNDENNVGMDNCSHHKVRHYGLEQNQEHKFDENVSTPKDTYKSTELDSSREPNPNRYLSPIKRRKKRSILQPIKKNNANNQAQKPIKPHHHSRATIDISSFMEKSDVEEYEPYKEIKKDMIYKSLTTKGKYYYIYFRNGAKEFLQTLIGWKLCGYIQLCIMTAANKYYAKSILCHLLNTNNFENYFDCIVSKEHLPSLRIKTISENNKECSERYRRVKTLNIIYDRLKCDRSVKCVMIDDNLRNFDVYDKIFYVYNIVEFRNPYQANDNYLDDKLKCAQNYIHSIVINHSTDNELVEIELNNAYKQYLLLQSDASFIQKLKKMMRNDANIEKNLLKSILIKKTNTLQNKIKIVAQFVINEEDGDESATSLNGRRNTANFLDRLLDAINISSFEYLDRYLMSGLIRIKKHDPNAFKSEIELFSTIVMFYRLYFKISNNANTKKYFCSNFNAFLFNLYCCNVLMRYHLCNYDGKQLMRDCMLIFAHLTVVGGVNGSNREDVGINVQIRFGRKIFLHFLQNVMYYVDPPYVFNAMFDKDEVVKLFPSRFRQNEKYTQFIRNQAGFFNIFQKYCSTLAVFIEKAFNSKIIKSSSSK